MDLKNEKWTTDTDQFHTDNTQFTITEMKERDDKQSTKQDDKLLSHIVIPVPIPVKTINNYKSKKIPTYRNDLHCIVEESTNLEDDCVSISSDDTKVQEKLIRYTLPTNGAVSVEMATSTGNNNVHISANSENIISLKKNWLRVVLFLLDRMDKYEALIYEKFWWSILYLNFWFPRLSHLIMYVNYVIIMGKNR